MLETNGKGKTSVLGTRIIEAVVIAAITAGATGIVALRVLEAKAEAYREDIHELKQYTKENSRAINQLTAIVGTIDAKAEERKVSVDARLRALEDRRR